MIYEMRAYECLPGRVGDLNRLMVELAVPVFEKLGMTLIGAQTPNGTPEVGGDSNTLHYMLAYPDMGARERAWEAFWQDPDWQAGRAKYTEEFGGPIVARTQSTFFKPTSYSPLK